MVSSDRGRLDPATVQAVYDRHSAELYNFLRGVLRDVHLAQDCLQSLFIKLAESGHTAYPASLKAGCFRVAFNLAMEVRRRERTGERIVREVAMQSREVNQSPMLSALQADEARRVQRALERLPVEQQTR